VAASTVTNPTNAHQLFPGTARVFPLPHRPKAHPHFRVFPTGETEYHWCIVALATNRTISRHKSLARALRKCSWLNEQRGKAQLDPPKVALSAFPDLNSDQADCQGVGNEAS
jgi:hypothetical protein